MDNLDHVIKQQKLGKPVGIPSLCTAHPTVLDAAMKYAIQNNTHLLIEATCNQVNQFGGYTGMQPINFVQFIQDKLFNQNLPSERIILGGDHLGPSPWQDKPSEEAMRNAELLVHDFVQAGFTKIHLDASMKLADDNPAIPLQPEIAAARSARLASIAEKAYPAGNKPRYVIGTEVPVPGGAREHEEGIAVTRPEDVQETIDLTRKAFFKEGLQAAWDRVIAVVVQPGVEFGDDFVLKFDPGKAQALSSFIETQPGLVYEAHSTDYQTEASLNQMVSGHFAILKVGPALTFAYREAVFALAQIEQEWLPAFKQSHLLQVIESVMQAEDKYWRNYYHGSLIDQTFARKYSLSDRIRYYWPDVRIQNALQTMMANLAEKPIPISLLSQCAPKQYQKIQAGEMANKPDQIVEDHICMEIAKYISATTISGGV